MGKYFNIVFWMIMFICIVHASEPINPLPVNAKYDIQKAALGAKLFSDPILSKDGSFSCETCHNLKEYGADNLKTAVGINGQIGSFNTPTVYNAGYNFRQFWDGRSPTLETQAILPILNPIEMGNDMKTVISRLQNSIYNEAFQEIFEDGITMENISEAIAEFEKTLITPHAPFDQYLRGDKHAISHMAKEGYALFKDKGCIVCHNGIGIGGNHFNKLGILKHLPSEQLGLYNTTHKEEDKYYFKVPSLRNVAKTAPYFHDGRTSSLEEAVKIMSLYQLARPINDEEVQLIVAFLETLTGQLPENSRH